jgi:hypothetical protein
MKRFISNKLVLVPAVVCLICGVVFAQRSRQKPKPRPAPVSEYPIFAVSDDTGKGPIMMEPIGVIKGGKIVAAFTDSGPTAVKNFQGKYYKAHTQYGLVFGGALAGKVSVVPGDLSGECSGNRAEATFFPARSNIKGLVMALATNAKLAGAVKGLRRVPSRDERAEIEDLVRSEFVAEKVPGGSTKKLRYQNLTALDIDRDGKPEFVGSYWLETSAERRDLLFFIAESNSDGKYALTYKEHTDVTPDSVMSGDVKDLDGGVGHELLLDVFDFDGDGISEIFTIVKAFEGNNFHVYKRKAGSWERVFENYNYHCAY